MNPGMTVVGLQEGSMLKVEGNDVELLGKKAAKVFRKGEAVVECAPGDSLQFLIQELERGGMS